MIRATFLILLLMFGAPLAAQQVNSASTAVLRTLDKVTGDLNDIELVIGAPVRVKRLSITLEDCRYPAGNPSGDAYAFLRIRDTTREAQVFEGWMIASSPALNALDHPRYDVWVLRCKTS